MLVAVFTESHPTEIHSEFSREIVDQDNSQIDQNAAEDAKLSVVIQTNFNFVTQMLSLF